MYSQYEEEMVILNYFGNRKGSFLDIGAYEGKTFSNTRALADRGWAGVCVEASPHGIVGMEKNYPEGSRVRIVQAVIEEFNGVVRFHDTPDAVGTTVESHYLKWKSQVPTYRTIWSACVTPQTLLQFFPPPYAFVSVDIEGKSVPVLSRFMREFRLSGHLPHLVCVEMEDKDMPLLRSSMKGYRVVGRTEENVLWGR